MNSTKINSAQYITESIMNSAHNFQEKLPILHSCLICTKLTKETSAHKTAAQFSDNIKTFCELFSLNKISCYDFESRLSTSLLCSRCKDRINLIARVARELNRLNEQLDILRESVCSDLTRVNGLVASSVLEDVDQDLNTRNSCLNKSNQENQCEIILQQKFRKLLKDKLTIPITWRSISFVHSTQEASGEQPDCNNISSFDHSESIESHNNCVSTNKEAGDKITITVFPSSSNSSDRPIIEFQGVDYINTESDQDFLEICQSPLDTVTDICNEFHDVATQGGDAFEGDDIKIEDNEDVSSEFEITAVDEIRTNSATTDMELKNDIPATSIEVDFSRNHGNENNARNGNNISINEPIDIGNQPSQPPSKLKNAVVALTRLSSRSVTNFSRSTVSNVNQGKTGGLVPVSVKSQNRNYCTNSYSSEDTNNVLDSISKPSNNELNSDAGLVPINQELISAPIREASIAGIEVEVEVENFSEFLDGDNIVQVEVATETDTTMQDVCEPAKALPAPSDGLNAFNAVLKFECPFVDPAKGYCPKMGRRYIDQQRLDAHLNRMHYGKKDHEYQCKQCHIGVNSLKRLLEHEKIHSGVKDWICRTCADSFRTETFLLFHQRKVHGELYPFVCDVCSKGFNYACHLRKHMFESHAGEFRFRCKECKAGFRANSALNNHILIHGKEEQFFCQWCSIQFPSKEGLTVHMATHMENKTWMCDTCGKSFRSRDELTEHWKVHRTDKSFACQIIEDNDDDCSDFEMMVVDDICTNSATADIDVSNANSEADIEDIKDSNRNHGDKDGIRNGDIIKKSKNVSEPIDIHTQPPAEPRIKLKNAVVILTRLRPRSVAKLFRPNVSHVNQTKIGGLPPVSSNSENFNCSANSNSGQDTNTALGSIKLSDNELNSCTASVTLSLEIIASSLPQASTTATDIEVEVENISEFSDVDNIVEVEVATETDTTMQVVCESAEAPPAALDKLNAQKTVRKLQCPFVDPVKGHCPKKGRRFINQQRLDAHLNRMHNGNGNKKHHKYKCKKCDVKLNSYISLGEHEKIHRVAKELICGTCAKSFGTENSLLFHQRKVHGALYPFVCDVCSKGFNFASLLRTHMRSHTGELRFRCKECKTGFYYQSALNNHIILIHASGRQSAAQDVCESNDKAMNKLKARKAILKFECPFVDPVKGYCPKRGSRYIDQERLDAHLNRMHYGKKDHEYQCKQCHVGVNTYKALIDHEKIHSGVKDWICRTCAESFRTEKFLLFHQRKVHGELYPFLCHVCSKGFNYACYLRLHMLSHAGEFKFRCEECNAGFHHKSSLDKHTIIHASERQFSCERCSKKFTSKGGLTVHMTIHLEDKPWLCDTCGKSFSRRIGLTEHREVHRTDKSFACQMCDFKTKTKASLGTHSRRHCKNRKKT